MVEITEEYSETDAHFTLYLVKLDNVVVRVISGPAAVVTTTRLSTTVSLIDKISVDYAYQQFCLRYSGDSGYTLWGIE